MILRPLTCSIQSPVVIALGLPLWAATGCPLETRMEWHGPQCSLPPFSTWPRLVVCLRWQMEEPQPSQEKQQLNSKHCGQALSRSYPPGFVGLRRAGRATACRPSKTEGCLVFWGLRLQQAQVQGESLEGNLVLTPPLVEFTRRKFGTYRINRRRKEQSVKGPLTKRIQTLILRTI